MWLAASWQLHERRPYARRAIGGSKKCNDPFGEKTISQFSGDDDGWQPGRHSVACSVRSSGEEVRQQRHQLVSGPGADPGSGFNFFLTSSDISVVADSTSLEQPPVVSSWRSPTFRLPSDLPDEDCATKLVIEQLGNPASQPARDTEPLNHRRSDRLNWTRESSRLNVNRD